MAGNGQKTEQPTQHRLQKARKEGKFPVSKDFLSSLQFLVVTVIILSNGKDVASNAAEFSVRMMRSAFSPDTLTTPQFVQFTLLYTRPLLMSLLIPGMELVGVIVLVQLASTGFGFAGQQLMPDLKRLNPMSKLTQLPGQNFAATVRALLFLPLTGYLVYSTIQAHLEDLVRLSGMALQSGLLDAQRLVTSVLWKLSFVLMVFGLVDFFRQRQRFQKNMRMTKQEIKDEHKEMEGNPQMKMRIRRLQRDLARKNMMKAVPTATAIIVNPTHYSVAISYDADKKAVPTVVAKGRNYLALLIKTKAIEAGVPIIENQPLAQALYKSVDVGQEIPAHLYRAVAEVLAYVFRTLNRR